MGCWFKMRLRRILNQQFYPFNHAYGVRMKRGLDYIGVGVGAVIVDPQGRLFLAQRGPLAKNERGLWEFPGGAVEFNERLADALKREMREEYGIEIEVGALLDVVDHILPQEGQHWVSPSYVCRILSGEPAIREPEKCSAIGWFAPSEVPPDLTVVTRQNLAHYLRIL
jgi:8-oxo-dGTP diphosphatase